MGLFKKSEKIEIPCNYCNEVIENHPTARYLLYAKKAVVTCQYLHRIMDFNDFYGACPAIVKAKEGSKNVKYCKYCGEDVKKGHSKVCPFVHGIKTRQGYIAWGIPATGDLPQDLQTARMGIINTMRVDDKGKLFFGPKERKVARRLVYEFLRFELRLINFLANEDKKKAEKVKKGFEETVKNHRRTGLLTSVQEEELLSGKLPPTDFLR
jgi:hypothetical protein